MTEQEVQILEAMLSRIEQCEETNRFMIEANKELVRGNQVLSESLDALRQEYECYTQNCIYEVLDPRADIREIFYPKICTIDETMERLLNGTSSLCRFGDGEFACISGNLRAGFTTKYYKELADRLTEVLKSNDDDVMIAIADNYGDLSRYSPQTRREIRNYMTDRIRSEHAKLLDADREYYNAYITRPFIFFHDDMDKIKQYIERFRQLWHNKKIVIIEGENTGFGACNDLLDNCTDIKRIIAPSVNAYSKYDRIFDAACSQDKDSLYLTALGPTATVLAYDLAKTGRRSVDIGHLDIEYEWMNRGEYRSRIPNKYVNEVAGGNEPEPIRDRLYREQIVAEIY